LFDLSSLSPLLSGLHTVGLTPSDTPSVLQLVAGFATLGNAGVPVTSTSTSVLANDLAIGKPFADTLSTLAVTLPQYDAQVFTSQLASGNLLNAVGLPIAADVGLVPYTLVIGAAFPVVNTVTGTVTQLAELTGLLPNPPAASPPAASAVNTTVSPAVSTKAGANTASAPNSVRSVVNTAVSTVINPVRSAVSSVITSVRSAVSSVTAPVRPALTGGSEPVTAAVGKPTTPAVSSVTAPVRPALTGGSEPVTAAVGKPTTPAVSSVTAPVRPAVSSVTTPALTGGSEPVTAAAGHGKKH
jgi:hypothetical protein